MANDRGALKISENAYKLLSEEKARRGKAFTKLIDEAVQLLVYGDQRNLAGALEIPTALYREVAWFVDLLSREPRDTHEQYLQATIKMFAAQWCAEKQEEQ